MSRVVVLGGGVNGLAAAVGLARRGRKVVLIEANGQLGGAAAGAEFHPGYRHAGLYPRADRVRAKAVSALGLSLKRADAAPTRVVTPDGHVDVPRPAQASASTLPEADRAAWAKHVALLERVRPFARTVLDAVAPGIGHDARLMPLLTTALGLRRLGQRDMRELLQIGPMPIDEWIAEGFTDPRVRAALCARALPGSWTGPRSPATVATYLLDAMLAGREVVGGGPAVVAALVGAAEAAGVELRTGTEAVRIEVEADRVRGVTLSDGLLEASAVVSALGPRQTLLGLVDPRQLPFTLEHEASRIRVRGIEAWVHLALSGPVGLTGGDVAQVLVADGPDDLERAFDAAKHHRLPERPALRLWVPTLADPSLAPEGHHVATVRVHGVPYDLEGGWDDAARQALLQSVLARLEAVAPGVGERVAGREVLSPVDVETRFGAEGGHLAHGELALDQLGPMRPFAAAAGMKTPIAGLILGCDGVHPGVGLTLGPGWLASTVA